MLGKYPLLLRNVQIELSSWKPQKGITRKDKEMFKNINKPETQFIISPSKTKLLLV